MVIRAAQPGLPARVTGSPSGELATGGAEGPPLWCGTALKADAWRWDLGASEYLVRAIRYGILERPERPFVNGEVLGDIPQSEEDLSFGREDLRR